MDSSSAKSTLIRFAICSGLHADAQARSLRCGLLCPVHRGHRAAAAEAGRESEAPAFPPRRMAGGQAAGAGQLPGLGRRALPPPKDCPATVAHTLGSQPQACATVRASLAQDLLRLGAADAAGTLRG